MIQYISSIGDIVVFGSILSSMITVSASMGRYIYRSIYLLIIIYAVALIHTSLYEFNIQMITIGSLSIILFLAAFYKLRKIDIIET
jgi:hypothetical protein